MNIPSFNTKALSETATALPETDQNQVSDNRTDDAQTVSFSFDVANRTDDAQTQFQDVSFKATNGTNTTTENATTETAITDDAQTQFRDVSFEAKNGTNTTTENATTEAGIQTEETEIGNEIATINNDWVDQMRNEFEKMQRLGKKHNKNNFCQ